MRKYDLATNFKSVEKQKGRMQTCFEQRAGYGEKELLVLPETNAVAF